MRVLCVDGYFDEEQKKRLTQWPLEGEEYTVRAEIRYTNGRCGYLLNEVVNPLIFDGKREPTFRTTRFVVLEGDESVVIEELEFETQM